MSDIFNSLYRPVLMCGIGPLEFWDLTYGEMCELIEAYNAKQKETIINQYNQAAMIADFVGRGIAGKDLPTVWEMFPQLEKPQELVEQEQKLAAQLYRDQFRAFAEQYNEQRKRT